MARRPKPFAVGSRVKAWAIRGPHKDGSGRWYWQATYNVGSPGKYPTIWTGWATRPDAESAVLAVAANGLPDQHTAHHSTDVRTVRDVLESWVWHVQNVGGRRGPLAPDSIRLYRLSAAKVAGDIGDVTVAKLSRVVVEDYRDRRLRAGLSTYTVSAEIRVLKMAYRWWADRAPVQLAPFPSVDLRTRPTGNRYTPTRGEALAVIDRLHGWGRIAGVLLFATGARPGEVSGLRWTDVDLRRSELHFNGKTGPRVVPISDDVVAILRDWRAGRLVASPTDRVCGVSIKTFPSTFGSRLLRRACEEAQVPVFTPYGLRRSAVDSMARAGVDIATAASITGHTPEVMLKYYRTVSDADRRTAVATARLGCLTADNVVPLRPRTLTA